VASREARAPVRYRSPGCCHDRGHTRDIALPDLRRFLRIHAERSRDNSRKSVSELIDAICLLAQTVLDALQHRHQLVDLTAQILVFQAGDTKVTAREIVGKHAAIVRGSAIANAALGRCHKPPLSVPTPLEPGSRSGETTNAGTFFRSRAALEWSTYDRAVWDRLFVWRRYTKRLAAGARARCVPLTHSVFFPHRGRRGSAPRACGRAPRRFPASARGYRVRAPSGSLRASSRSRSTSPAAPR